MLKEIQYDHMGDRIVHVDFIRVDANQMVTVNVPLHVSGEAYGVKNEDGFFDFVNREVRIQCLPAAIPKEIIIDISELHAGDSIKYADLKLPEGLRSISDPHMVVCTVTGTFDEEEGAAEKAATPA
jgi:large subunit ribosomal protein L25